MEKFKKIGVHITVNEKKMRHGSLESGIGMFDYAAEMMGWENVFHCEINTFCQTILKYYWPQSKSYADIFNFSGTEWRGKVDIITAGFPCQPFSHAGQRKGSEDDRFIWPENMRIFREAQPPFIVCENVPGLLTIENGMVFEQVCADLENEGYEVQTFIIPAVATDKDHRRDRLWIIAYCDSYGQRNFNRLKENTGTEAESEGYGLQRQRLRNEFGRIYTNATNSFNQGLQRSEWSKPFQRGEKVTHGAITQCNRNTERKENWIEAATRLCIVDDGNAGGLDLKTISESKWRIESLKGSGNTIIWEIAFEIFKTIETFKNTNPVTNEIL